MTLVVVGASLAGLRAVQAARRAGYTGRLVLVGAEPHLPYDRPPLSKAYLHPDPPPAAPTYSSAAELAALGVELRLGTVATGLDPQAREVELGDERLRYDALVVATGARARELPGEQLDGVHALRTVDDARAVAAGLDGGARPVVVGAGFIGTEVASAARARGSAVTVLEAGEAPLGTAVGARAAALLAQLHARHGTDLRCGARVAGLVGERAVQGVRLGDGEVLPADLVVVGIGCTPATHWCEDVLPVDDGIVCDATLQVLPGVHVAGDVARVPHPTYGPVRLEHWTSAADQGALAGANAVAALTGGTPRPYDAVPYFWSDVYGAKAQMVGLPRGEADELLGDPDGPWLLLYRDGDRLAGALSLDLPGRIMKFRALLSRGGSWDDAVALARSRPLPVPAG